MNTLLPIIINVLRPLSIHFLHCSVNEKVELCEVCEISSGFHPISLLLISVHNFVCITYFVSFTFQISPNFVKCKEYKTTENGQLTAY